VSDPGWKLAAEAAEAGATVTAAPGASAVLAALCVSGLPSDRFLFAGFLPQKAGARRAALAELARVPATLVFYEAPRRAAEALRAMAEILGPDRQAAMCRELTKRFEEVRRGTIAELAEALGAEPAPKGEAVLVIGPPDASAPEGDAESVDEQLRAALARGSVKDAARDVAALTGRPRAELYARALVLRDE
jgi:16S rRNA (cytidine1402-2'-O)-methyltransferase